MHTYRRNSSSLDSLKKSAVLSICEISFFHFHSFLKSSLSGILLEQVSLLQSETQKGLMRKVWVRRKILISWNFIEGNRKVVYKLETMDLGPKLRLKSLINPQSLLKEKQTNKQKLICIYTHTHTQRHKISPCLNIIYEYF